LHTGDPIKKERATRIGADWSSGQINNETILMTEHFEVTIVAIIEKMINIR
jgi:hypothetical protein